MTDEAMLKLRLIADYKAQSALFSRLSRAITKCWTVSPDANFIICVSGNGKFFTISRPPITTEIVIEEHENIEKLVSFTAEKLN